jgi:DNA-binding CsgD family transcriptional regulator
LGAAMFSRQAWDEIARNLKLSGRELQIIKDVFDDRTESAIAAHYDVSPHTVHTHCERLYHKLAVTDRVKLVLRITDEFLALTAAPGSNLPSICTNRAAAPCVGPELRFWFSPSAFFPFAFSVYPSAFPHSCPLNSRHLNSRLLWKLLKVQDVMKLASEKKG